MVKITIKYKELTDKNTARKLIIEKKLRQEFSKNYHVKVANLVNEALSRSNSKNLV